MAEALDAGRLVDVAEAFAARDGAEVAFAIDANGRRRGIGSAPVGSSHAIALADLSALERELWALMETVCVSSVLHQLKNIDRTTGTGPRADPFRLLQTCARGASLPVDELSGGRTALNW